MATAKRSVCCVDRAASMGCARMGHVRPMEAVKDRGLASFLGTGRVIVDVRALVTPVVLVLIGAWRSLVILISSVYPRREAVRI